MNRTLKRPMFRMGGSANEGITSGLDTPKRGLVDGPGKYSQSLPYNMADLVTQSRQQAMDPDVRAAYQPYFERPQGEGLSRFLINFGLDLASRPPQGGFLATAAAAAKEPTRELFEDIDQQRLSKRAAEADLFKTLLEGNIDIAEAGAEGTAEGTASKGVKLQIADDIENTMDIIFKLENKKVNTPDQFTAEDSLLLDKKKLRIEQLTKSDEAQRNEGPKIDFDTLRARLPKEIGDDIVKLIAASPEALEDFATIATQQDVDMFNQKYSVNLVLPQEA